METTLKKWGNSRGVVIPANTLKAAHAHIGEKFKITTREDGTIILKPAQSVHEKWKAAFNKMADNKDDLLLDEYPTKFDEEEWQW
jgi:antitoxin MazE